MAKDGSDWFQTRYWLCPVHIGFVAAVCGRVTAVREISLASRVPNKA